MNGFVILQYSIHIVSILFLSKNIVKYAKFVQNNTKNDLPLEDDQGNFEHTQIYQIS